MVSSMKDLLTFPRGGIHPEDKKKFTEEKAIRNTSLPVNFVVPLSQHIGRPAECLVSEGDEVSEGMLIGKSTGFISARIHSPVPGVVKSLKEIYLPNGTKTEAVEIELKGEFNRLGKKVTGDDWEKYSSKEIQDIIFDKGIVGLGGATFPCHVKFSIPDGSKVRSFVVNGVECEPYLTADHRLMIEKTAEIIEGIKIISRVIEPEEIIIGIEKNKPDAIELMRNAAVGFDIPVRVVPLKLKYPQGDEKQLLKALTGREVPSGGLPIHIGAVVSNVASVFAVYEAVVYQKPLIERVLTVSGGAIKNPANLKVRIGTPIGELIEDCGGFRVNPEKIVVGGPMMGFSIYDLDTPVTKGTSGILALTSGEVKSAGETHCLSCGRCVTVCPMGLNPTEIYKLIDHLEYDYAGRKGLMDCKECGCCGYTCPAHIPLVHGFKLGKYMAKKTGAGA